MRLNKFLAKTGLASRRKCDEFISNGLIKINEKIVTDFSYKVIKDDIVKYKNKILEFENENVLYMLNKPKNYICTSNDPYDRKKITDLIPSRHRLFSIGRLDYKTTGLILLTNNGDLANNFIHPKNRILRKYEVHSNRQIKRDNIKSIKKGIIINNVAYKADISIITKIKNPESYLWNVALREGKNREIRKIFEFLNQDIYSLHRYEFAGIKLGSLKPGKFKKIKISELIK